MECIKRGKNWYYFLFYVRVVNDKFGLFVILDLSKKI